MMKPTGIAEYVYEHDGPCGWRIVCDRCVEDALSRSHRGRLGAPGKLALHGVRVATLDTGGPFICYVCGARYSPESRRWGRAAYTGKLKMEIPKDFREAAERAWKKHWVGNVDLFGGQDERAQRNAEDAQIRAEIERQSYQQYSQTEKAERKRAAQPQREILVNDEGDTATIGPRKRWRRRIIRRLRRWLRCIDHFTRSGDTFGRRTAIEAAQDFRDRGAMGLEKRREWRAYR